MFSSIAALKVVKMTIFGAVSDENFIKMMTFMLHWFVCLTQSIHYLVHIVNFIIHRLSYIMQNLSPDLLCNDVYSRYMYAKSLCQYMYKGWGYGL